MGDDAQEIVCPLRCRDAEVVEILLKALIKILGKEPDPAGIISADRQYDFQIDCSGKHEPFVVIGMFSDQVDPPGCTDDDRTGSVEALEVFSYRG